MPTQFEQCNLCFGRGYRAKGYKNKPGAVIRNCSRCQGSGEVQVGTKNHNPWLKKATQANPV